MRRTIKERLRRSCVQTTVLFRTVTHVVSVSKQGIFINKQHEFCARGRCQIDSSGDWTLLFIHRTGTAQTAALRASPQCLVNVSQPCSGGTPCWGEKAVQSLHVLSILGLTARGAEQGVSQCQLCWEPAESGLERDIFHTCDGSPAVFLLSVTEAEVKELILNSRPLYTIAVHSGFGAVCVWEDIGVKTKLGSRPSANLSIITLSPHSPLFPWSWRGRITVVWILDSRNSLFKYVLC